MTTKVSPQTPITTYRAALISGVVLVIAACDRTTRNAEPAPASSAAGVAMDAAAPVVLSAATFGVENDKLLSCTDMRYTAVTGASPDWRARILSWSGPAKADGGVLQEIRIQKPCSEQFANRPALATCSLPRECGDAGTCWAPTLSYYSLALLRDSDSLMKTCLMQGGDWRAARPDSLEYLEQDREETRRRLEEGRATRGEAK